MKRNFIAGLILILTISGCSYNNNEISSDNADFGYYKMPYEAKALFSEGINSMNEKRQSDALEQFSRFVKIYPEFPQGYYNLGLILANNNQYKEAVENWEKCVSLDRKNADAYFNMAEGYKILYDNENSIKNYKKYLELKPEDKNKEAIIQKIKQLQKATIGNGVIGKVLLTDKNGLKNNVATTNKSYFEMQDEKIYSSVEVLETKNEPEITAQWNYFIDNKHKLEVNKVKLNPTKPENILLSITKPKDEWIKGRYSFEVYVNNALNVETIYYIQ